MLSGAAGTLFHLAGGSLVFYLFYRDMARKRLATEGMALVAAAALVGSFLGAILLNFPGWLAGHWREWNTGDLVTRLALVMASGRTWIGAVLGGYALVEWTKRRLGIRRSTGDSFALALPLGEAVGRLGCLAYGCCYGAPTTMPWGIVQHGAARHPTQLYSALLAVLLWFGLRALRGRLPREGDLFKLYLAGYAVTRFGVEFFRDHQGATGLSTAQWTCLAGLALLGVFWLPGFLAALRAPRAPEALLVTAEGLSS
jgi:phosphatidylglycerol:prolipoprotein diacylglycerol transferase